MKAILLSFSVILLSACNQQTISYKEISQRTNGSKDIVQEFAKQLKEKLQTAIKDGGALNAISVCNEQAPFIAKQLSEQSGWDIHRTSLKHRATKPDAWETTIMQSFEQKYADGDKFKRLFAQDVVEINNKPAFRYMQAIETKKICLLCHGESIAPELASKITELYPDDIATGFKLGSIRGAFSIVQYLD
ncbi:MAG: DUF3365 domain-containing protein [Alcanivoracaceae bacterium]|nr:DUF3365 domain-containing protein [Alcanivoracaceae bacterium]